MRARLVTTAVSVLILSFAALPARGQQGDRSRTIVDPGLPPAVEIKDIEIVGRPVVSNTFELRVRYTSHVNAPGEIAVRVPEAVALTAAPAGRRLMRQPLTFQKGQTQTQTFTLRATEAAGSIVHIGITVPTGTKRLPRASCTSRTRRPRSTCSSRVREDRSLSACGSNHFRRRRAGRCRRECGCRVR